MYWRNEIALGIAKTTQSRTENGILLRHSDAVASPAPFIACDCRQSTLAHSSWMMFHVKHVGPGGSSSRAHNALNERLLLRRLGILVNDDANGFVVDHVVDAADVAATCHEVDDIGA